MCGGGSDGSELAPEVRQLFGARAAREGQINTALLPTVIQQGTKGSPYFNDILDYMGGRGGQYRASARAGLLRQLRAGGVTDPAVLASVQAMQERNLQRGYDQSLADAIARNEAFMQGAQRIAFGGQADPLQAAAVYKSLYD